MTERTFEAVRELLEKLVNKYGYYDKYHNSYVLNTFDYCSEEGYTLDDSTIDAIVFEGGLLKFIYNVNESYPEWDGLSAFNFDEMYDFATNLEEYLKKNENND